MGGDFIHPYAPVYIARNENERIIWIKELQGG